VKGGASIGFPLKTSRRRADTFSEGG